MVLIITNLAKASLRDSHCHGNDGFDNSENDHSNDRGNNDLKW
jgi:hypothetical protein